MAAERNTEIWSTRLQRELLALTTDNASAGAKEDVAGVLPPFVTVKTHELDFPNGDCAVSFLIDIVKPGGNASSTDDMIVVTMDASLQKKDNGTVDPIAVAYPFLKPSAYLTSGSKRFPDGSTIKDGDEIDIEMDWTPSLHLTDAILNVALKIKESILQEEPFHGAKGADKQDPVEEMVNKAKRFGSSFRKGLAGLAEKGSSPAEKADDKDKSPKKGGLRLPGRKKKKEEKKPTSATKAPKANSGEIRIGDEINMLEAPWVDCQGVYSCKAIRRPTFVDDAIAVAAQSTEENNQVRSASVFRDDDKDDRVPTTLNDYMSLQAGTIGQVAQAGFSGAGAMFRTFTQSARSVLEESFLMITETHIIEMRSNKLNLSTGVVTFAIPIDMMAKLKFRRQESISLFFKPAPDDPLIYMCPDSADAVHQIQSVLKRHGVKGKHTNAATHRAINQALHLVQEIQTKELALKHDPSVERVNEIMDLYRQAAERFEVAGDVRHEEVVTHMRKFLALPLTVSILDGSYKKPDGDDAFHNSGVGLVLEANSHFDDEDDHEEARAPKMRGMSDDKAFEENMASILKEAEADLAHLKLEDDPELDAMFEDNHVPVKASTGDDDYEDSAIADFENMLKEADNELAELMNS